MSFLTVDMLKKLHGNVLRILYPDIAQDGSCRDASCAVQLLGVIVHKNVGHGICSKPLREGGVQGNVRHRHRDHHRLSCHRCLSSLLLLHSRVCFVTMSCAAIPRELPCGHGGSSGHSF